MQHPCKGKLWFYLGTGIMLSSLVAFAYAILSTVTSGAFESISNYYFIFLALFLSAFIFRIYAITPLMSPIFAITVVIFIFGASQIFSILNSYGYFILGLIFGHFAELGAFSWAYSASRKLYVQQPL